MAEMCNCNTNTDTEIGMDHYRSFGSPDLEVRSAGDGRTIVGIAVPYETPQRINDSLIEQFARGAFNHQLRAANRIKFAREHLLLGGSLIGAATSLRDDAAGLYGEFRVSKTPLGDETLELVKDGALSHLSVHFYPRSDRRVPGTGVIERVKADLFEVAVVLQGAYGDNAAVTGVRCALHSHTPTVGTPNLDKANQMLAAWKPLPLL